METQHICLGHHLYSEVSHWHNLGDLILNTAQMCDAIHVQRFRLQSPELDGDAILTASVACKIQSQKANAKAPKKTVPGACTPSLSQSVTPLAAGIHHWVSLLQEHAQLGSVG